MSEMPPDLRELYFIFGVTAEKAQVMETAAGNAALAYVTLFVDTSNITPEMTEWFKQLLDDVNSKTFGILLRTIKKSINIDENTLAVIDEALKSGITLLTISSGITTSPFTAKKAVKR